MHKLGMASVEKAANGQECLTIEVNGVLHKFPLSLHDDAASRAQGGSRMQLEGISSFISNLKPAPNPPKPSEVAAWATRKNPVPHASYPDVSPVDFRLPLFESFGNEIQWLDHSYPFVTFMHGRAGSHKTSFLASINHETQYLNRTHAISIMHQGDTMKTMYRIREVFSGLRNAYRTNDSTYRNPFRRENVFVLIDNIPSSTFSTVETEILYAELYEGMDKFLPNSMEFVKVFIATEKPLNSVFTHATNNNYATLQELPTNKSVADAINRIYGTQASPKDVQDILGRNLWLYEKHVGRNSQEMIVKTPSVPNFYMEEFAECWNVIGNRRMNGSDDSTVSEDDILSDYS